MPLCSTVVSAIRSDISLTLARRKMWLADKQTLMCFPGVEERAALRHDRIAFGLAKQLWNSGELFNVEWRG
jgi:hypothetical protein